MGHVCHHGFLYELKNQLKSPMLTNVIQSSLSSALVYSRPPKRHNGPVQSDPYLPNNRRLWKGPDQVAANAPVGPGEWKMLPAETAWVSGACEQKAASPLGEKERGVREGRRGERGVSLTLSKLVQCTVYTVKCLIHTGCIVVSLSCVSQTSLYVCKCSTKIPWNICLSIHCVSVVFLCLCIQCQVQSVLFPLKRRVMWWIAEVCVCVHSLEASMLVCV